MGSQSSHARAAAIDALRFGAATIIHLLELRGGLPVIARERSTPAPTFGEPGEILDGRYRVLGRLGRGGAGSVFLVQDIASGQELALKRLADEAGARVEALFEREYYTLSAIRHPNVVEVYDYGSAAGRPYYTMEVLRGADLGGLAPVAFRVALAFVRDAARALTTLHARHLVHRDVAPRNLWLGEAGGLKLLDFGALTAFGTPGDVVGTPPCVAPEALAGQALDQRTDLYALGALLYWLLTGEHAYPARSLRELPQHWDHAPARPSARLARLARDDLPPIPDDVDALTLELLSHDPSARPATAGEVIDRIAIVLGGPAPALEGASRELLMSRPAFVGRTRKRKHFMRQLSLALSRRGGATLIEAERGQGATRLLSELCLEARLEGAVGVHVDGAHAGVAGGLLGGIVARLLDARPAAAQRAFAPHAAMLSTLHETVRRRLALETDGASVGPVLSLELPSSVEDAVVAAVVALSREAPLVLLLDDLGQARDVEVAAIAALAERAADEALLLVCTARAYPGSARPPGMRALSRVARHLTLEALSLDDCQTLVRSVFSDVPYLSRLVERVHRTTRGNPLHVMELLRQLVESDVVRQVDGTWVVPQELPDLPFERTQTEALLNRLTRLSAGAMRIARRLSVSAGVLSLAAVKALAGLQQRELFEALAELARERVLHSAEHGYRFADEDLRIVLRAKLDDDEAQAAHLALGTHLYHHEAVSLSARIDAAIHMLDGGEREKAPGLVAQLVHELALTDADKLVPLVPRLERALAVFRAQGRSAYAQSGLLFALTVSGYFSDRRLAVRYGPDTTDILCKATGLTLAARLRPWLGGALALIVGLIVGMVRLSLRRRDPCVPAFRAALVNCISACTALAGVAAISIDPKEVLRCATLLAPLDGFGPKHPFSVFARFPRTLSLAVSDRFGESVRELRRLLERLDEPAVKRLIAEDVRERYRGGVLYALAVQTCWREDPEALRIADELDANDSALYAMSADQVRTLYFANRGDLARFEAHRHRAEMYAIQRGTAWQIETWLPGAMITAAFRSRDAMAMKQAIEQLERLEQRTPSLNLVRIRAQGAYLLLRRRPVEALPFLEACLHERHAEVIGWARAHGAYVAALNALGQHERALNVAAAALNSLDDAGRVAWAMTLGLQIEHAVARSGLADHAGAEAELTTILKACGESAGPLSLGNVHEALAFVLRAADNHAHSDQHFAEMARIYRSTQIPSLAAHVQVLTRSRQRQPTGAETRDFEATMSGAAHGQITAQLVNSLDGVLGEGQLRRERLADRTLTLLADQSQSACGGIWFVNEQGGELAAKFGAFDEHGIDAWVAERLLHAAADDITQTDFLDDPDAPDPNQLVRDGHSYQLLLIGCSHDGREVLVAAAVLQRSLTTRLVSHDLLRAIGGKLMPHLTLDSSLTGRH